MHKTAAWGQGPVLLQQLAMLEALGVADLVRTNDTVELVHTVVEVAKLAFADREAWYGDVADVPLDTLLSAAYAAERARLVGSVAVRRPPAGLARRARPPASPRPCGRLAQQSAPGVGEPTVSPIGLSPGDTCHVDVVDRWGNRVSATPSGGWLQSSPVVPGLGFALPTRAQMFWLEPGLPNSLVPGKRPRTTLSPALLLDDDGSGVAFGTPGGDQQDQWTVPFLLRHLVGGAGLQAADRRADVALDARARARSTRAPTRRADWSPSHGSGPACWTRSRTAATRWRPSDRGSSGGSARPACARTGCWWRRRTRAACRATPSAGDQVLR